MQSIKNKMWWVTLRRLTAVVLVVLIIAPSLSLSVAPKQADAQAAQGLVAGAAGCLIAGAVGEILAIAGAAAAINAVMSVPVSDLVLAGFNEAITGINWSALVKECVLDALVWTLKNVLIDQLTGEILNWINSGFEGTPTFISDPAQFLTDLNQNAITYWLQDAEIYNQVCRPFRRELWVNLQIQALRPNHNPRGGYAHKACTLETDFVGGLRGYEEFMRGDSGSFSFAKMETVGKDQNNPVGAFLEMEKSVTISTGKTTGSQNSLMGWNGGNMSIRCDLNNDGEKESTCTPGSYIANQVNQWTGGGLKTLEAADEFAEIINALISHLVMSLLTDDEGLLSGNKNNWETRGRDIYDSRLRSPNEEIDLPDPPPGEDPPGISPACRDALDNYKQALFGGLQALQSAIFRAGAEAAWSPRLNVFSSNLGHVMTDEPDAYEQLRALHDELERFDTQFQPAVDNVQVSDVINPPGEDCGFGTGGGGGGACGTLVVYRGNWYTNERLEITRDWPDLRDLMWSTDYNFTVNDTISSIQLNESSGWEVCKAINYGGECQIVTTDRNFGGSWENEISSIRCSDPGDPPLPSTCPVGYTGTPPNCVPPPAVSCPAQLLNWSQGTAQCSGYVELASADTSVRVATAPGGLLSGSATFTCGATGAWSSPVNPVCASTPPTVSITAIPGVVEVGQFVTITWSSQNAESCVASNGNALWPGPKEVNGNRGYQMNVPANYTFTITCTNSVGVSATANTYVDVSNIVVYCPADTKYWTINNIECIGGIARTPVGQNQRADDPQGGFTDRAYGSAWYSCNPGGVWSNTYLPGTAECYPMNVFTP